MRTGPRLGATRALPRVTAFTNHCRRPNFEECCVCRPGGRAQHAAQSSPAVPTTTACRQCRRLQEGDMSQPKPISCSFRPHPMKLGRFQCQPLRISLRAKISHKRMPCCADANCSGRHGPKSKPLATPSLVTRGALEPENLFRFGRCLSGSGSEEFHRVMKASARSVMCTGRRKIVHIRANKPRRPLEIRQYASDGPTCRHIHELG